MVKKNKKLMIGIMILFTLVFSLSSFAYYTNIGRWLDQQGTTYYGGEGQRRVFEGVDDFIEDGCGTGTMLDTVTGLCWDKNLNRFGSRDWLDAVNDCDTLNYAGHTDWRLPQRDELMTLVDLIGGVGTTCTTLGNFGFNNCLNKKFWTSNLDLRTANKYWFVDFTDCASNTESDGFGFSVVCVRRN